MHYLTISITIGFLGSFHCVGMCGPIALALPVHNKPLFLRYALILLYNSGRIITYSLFGLLAGSIGKGFVLAGFQQVLSIAIGLILLLSVFFSFSRVFSGYTHFLRLRAAFQRLFSKGTKPSLFTIGLLNGLLPCGLVYMGIAGAASMGDALKGVLFMTAFGIGTVPMMFAVPAIGSTLPVSARNVMRKATPLIVTTMALLLIVRGLNLGIPYLSPKVEQKTHTATPCHNVQVTCCHKN